MKQDASATIVEDLFLTDTFLIKGRMANKFQRLGRMLEGIPVGFLTVEDASMVSLRTNEVIRTPRVLVNTKELILAHELVDVAGDDAQRRLASDDKTTRVRAFYSGAVQLELSGMISRHAYEPENMGGRLYFTMVGPTLRGLDLKKNAELGILGGLTYAIVRKDRLAYVYDFS